MVVYLTVNLSMQFISPVPFKSFRIFMGSTRAGRNISPTYHRAGKIIIPTRASHPKNKEGGRSDESNRL